MSLDLTGIGSIADLGSKIIDWIHPDPAKKAEAQTAWQKVVDDGKLAERKLDLEADAAQVDLDKAEVLAGSHWRERLGNVCVYGFAYEFLANPVLSWASINFHILAPPQIDTGPLGALLVGMLGLGAMHVTQVVKQNGNGK